MREDEQLNTDEDALMSSIRAMCTPVTFDAGFIDRTMARVASTPRLADELLATFWRLTPLAIAATLLLSTFNLFTSSSVERSLVDRLLSLPRPTVATTYALDDDFSAWGR